MSIKNRQILNFTSNFLCFYHIFAIILYILSISYFTYSSYYFSYCFFYDSFYNFIILFIIRSISVDRFIFILYTE